VACSIGVGWGSPGPRVPGYLGRVLNDSGVVAGTCFQVAPGVLVTAAHVVDNACAGDMNARLSIDSLDGGEAFGATVAQADRDHDVAVIVAQGSLSATASLLADTDSTPLRTGVSATGYAVIDDRGHQYRYLVAAAEWAGPTRRDEIPLGSMTTTRIMPGMSGAPVVRDTDAAVIGLVSGRYNSADGWLVGNVWVARTEDLVPLLGQFADIRVDRVLAVLEVVTTVLRVSNSSDMRAKLASGAGPHAQMDAGGTREAVWAAAKVLAALDDGARGIGALTNVVHNITAKAASTGRHTEQEVQAFRRRIELRGLDPRLLIRGLTGHDEAVERWGEEISGANGPPKSADPSAMLATYIAVLIGEISGTLFSSLSFSCRALLRDALTDEHAAPVRVFLLALEEVLPTRRSVSREVVLYRPIEADESGASHPHPALTYRERGLQLAASQLCKLPDADPYICGREDLVARMVSAANKVMARDGAAVCFLSGQPGIGASTVAIEVARQLAPAFADGVWYVNLYGLVPGSRRDARTVIRLLAEAMALELSARTMDDERMFAEFTAQLSQRKALVVLDNAADAAHVKPLARPPASCAVIVTSRNRLQDYASPGLVFGVGALDQGAAIEVLKTFADEHTHDVAQLDALARLCDRVPLALRMIGARIAVRPPVELDYLVHLLLEEVNRLDYLEVGERAVRASIRLSYDDLDASAQRVLRFITAVPGSMASGKELGHSLGEPAFHQEMLLSRLEDRNLVEHKVVNGYITGSLLVTFSPFELVRLFARERLLADESADLINDFEKKSVSYLSSSLRQIIDHAHDAELSWELDPTRFHAALRVAEEREWLELATDLALNLHVLYLSIHELDSAREINDLLVGLHLRGGNYEEAVRACLRAAESLGDLGACEQAVSAARRARKLALAHNLALLAAEADFATSVLLYKLDDLPRALDTSERAAHAFIDLGHQVSAIPPVLNNCKLALELSQSDKAVFWGRRATDLADHTGSIVQRADAALNRGRSEALVGNLILAVDLSRQAGALYEHEEYWWNSAVAFENGALFSRRTGDTAGAAELLSSAADLWERVPKEESRPHFLESLIDLSAVQAEMSAFAQTQLSLRRAAELITRWPQSIPAAMRFEASVRKMAVKVFFEDSHRYDEEPAISLPAEQKGEGAEQSHSPDAELEQIATIVRQFNAGEITHSEAQSLVARFLATPARTHAEGPPFWLHQEIDVSSRSRTAISTGQQPM
jgi:hypothetical protein